MRALRILGPGLAGFDEIGRPEAGEGEVLLQMVRVGFCGSDLSTFEGRNPMVAYPRIPGHEIGARVAAVGPGVPQQIAEGAAVMVVPYSSCGQCAACRRGRAHACRSNQTLGVQRDGAMTEFLVVPWTKVVAVAGLGFRQLALVEPLTVGFHAVDRAQVAAADVVVVFGCGVIGLGAIAGAACRGATVVAVDIEDSKLDLARSLGAAHGINSRSGSLHESLQELTGGHGPDVAIEAVGRPATYRACVEEVAFTGRVACIGYAKDDVAFATKLWVQKELDIRGSRNASGSDFERVAGFLAGAADFPYDRVITREVPFDEAGQALADWSSRPGAVTKILVALGE